VRTGLAQAGCGGIVNALTTGDVNAYNDQVGEKTAVPNLP
jgi:hypothetical protein